MNSKLASAPFTPLKDIRKQNPDVGMAALFVETIFNKKLDPQIKVYTMQNEGAFANKHEKYMNLQTERIDPTIHVHEFVHMLEKTNPETIKELLRVESSIYAEGRATFIQEIYRIIEYQKYEFANQNCNRNIQKRQEIVEELSKVENQIDMVNKLDPNTLPKTPPNTSLRNYFGRGAKERTFASDPKTWLIYIFFYKQLRKLAIELNDCLKAFQITTEKPPGILGKLFPLTYYRKEINEAKESKEIELNLKPYGLNS